MTWVKPALWIASSLSMQLMTAADDTVASFCSPVTELPTVR
jgi:hypothetical protein